MNIEEAIEILKDNIKSLEGHTPFKHTNYEKVKAIETLLTAYEKEKEEVQIQAKQLIEIDGNYISKEEAEQKEKKAYIDGTNSADKLCNKKWEDKIKAKIEEYEEKIKKIKEKNVWEEPYDTEKYVRYTNYISVLQSLLKEE